MCVYVMVVCYSLKRRTVCVYVMGVSYSINGRTVCVCHGCVL